MGIKKKGHGSPFTSLDFCQLNMNKLEVMIVSMVKNGTAQRQGIVEIEASVRAGLRQV